MVNGTSDWSEKRKREEDSGYFEKYRIAFSYEWKVSAEIAKVAG